MSKGIYHRSELLLGKEVMEQLAVKKAIIFGIGGVGSWCAESLVRTGLTNLTIVDSDLICITNVNRQLMATTQTVGRVKTEALKERLLEINPDAQINDIQKIYCMESADDFNLDQYDIIIDAIDSLSSKAHLIQQSANTQSIFVSSMGAALKTDLSRIKVDSFWNVKGCPLARKVRKMVRRQGAPERDFSCVYSDEVAENKGLHIIEELKAEQQDVKHDGPGDPELVNHKWDHKKASVNGSLSHITGIYGLTLAGLVISAIQKECSDSSNS